MEADESSQGEDSVTNDVRPEILLEQCAPDVAGLKTGAQKFMINRLH